MGPRTEGTETRSFFSLRSLRLCVRFFCRGREGMITQRHRGHGGALAAARAEYYFSALSAPLRETFGCRMGLFHAEARRARRIYIIPLWPLCLCVRFFCRGREGMITQRHRGHGGALAAARAEYYFSALSAPLREIFAAEWYLCGSVGSVRDFFMGAHAEAQSARSILGILSDCNGGLARRARRHGDFFSALSAPLREIFAAEWYLRGSVGSVRGISRWAHTEAQRGGIKEGPRCGAARTFVGGGAGLCPTLCFQFSLLHQHFAYCAALTAEIYAGCGLGHAYALEGVVLGFAVGINTHALYAGLSLALNGGH